MKWVTCSKPGYTSITCSKILNIPYNLFFTTIAIILFDYLNLPLANEYVGDVTIPTQVIKYNQNFLQADQPIRLQYSNLIELFAIKSTITLYWKSYLQTWYPLILHFALLVFNIGAPAEMYTKGTQYYLYMFGQMWAVVMATVLFVPLFYPLKMTSMYQVWS